jgi:Xaa-Pro dipeptidase
MTDQVQAEADRRAALRAAEECAERLFDAIKQAQLVAPGRTELMVEEEIYALAARQFGVEKHWHKRIVRAGLNTLGIAGDPDLAAQPQAHARPRYARA